MKLHSRNRKRKLGEFQGDGQSEIPDSSQASGSVFKKMKLNGGSDDTYSQLSNADGRDFSD
jgi:hypothetical protein